MEELLKLMETGLSDQESLIKEYPEYPPIVNSGQMLLELRNNINKNSFLLDNRDRLNIGFLAAKALDFEDETQHQNLLIYSNLLHTIWSKFLLFIGQSHPKHPLSGKEKVAYDFYKEHYLLLNGQPDDNKIFDHMSGIDFKFQVKPEEILTNEQVCQWRAIGMPQGDYYTDVKLQTRPDCLGINEYQEDYQGNLSKRVKHHHVITQDIDVLRSIAAGVLDTWSVKGAAQKTTGGCIQYFNSKKIFFNQQYP